MDVLSPPLPSCPVRVTLLGVLAALLLVPPAAAQNEPRDGAIRLIVRGDDMGFSHAVNEACESVLHMLWEMNRWLETYVKDAGDDTTPAGGGRRKQAPSLSQRPTS